MQTMPTLTLDYYFCVVLGDREGSSILPVFLARIKKQWQKNPKIDGIGGIDSFSIGLCFQRDAPTLPKNLAEKIVVFFLFPPFSGQINMETYN